MFDSEKKINPSGLQGYLSPLPPPVLLLHHSSSSPSLSRNLNLHLLPQLETRARACAFRMVHYTSACAAGGGGGAKPSQSWFYIPLGLLCATIAAASGGLGDNLVRLSYIRAERRKEEREGEADSLSPLERGAASARERVEKGGGSDSEEDMMDFPIAGEEGDASPMRDRRPTLVVRIVGGPGGSRCPRIAAALPAELMRPYWVAGWSLTTFINSGGVVLAMGLAPASMIIPFAAVHIAFAVTFARVVNKEVRVEGVACREKVVPLSHLLCAPRAALPCPRVSHRASLTPPPSLSLSLSLSLSAHAYAPLCTPPTHTHTHSRALSSKQ